jgi:hypothetical protein
MPLADLSRDSVLAAISECDRAGRRGFLSWHGYGPSHAYDLVYRGRRYPSKAIAGVAHGYEHGTYPLLSTEFSGGAEHTARALVYLGFAVLRDGKRLTTADVEIPRRFGTRPAADLRLYVVRPTNARSVAECKHYGFGTLLSPMTVLNKRVSDMSGYVTPIEGLPYVLDNGAWACHQAGIEWKPEPMRTMVERLGLTNGGRPNWLVLPDIVMGGMASLERSLRFLDDNRPWLDTHVPHVALAVQNGMTPEVVGPLLEQHGISVIFVGGSTEWKWATVHQWSELGLDLGIRVHVGRVNGLHRAELCRDLGVASIDGSSVTVFSVNAEKMSRAHDGTEEAGPQSKHTIAQRRFRLALGSAP